MFKYAVLICLLFSTPSYACSNRTYGFDFAAEVKGALDYLACLSDLQQSDLQNLTTRTEMNGSAIAALERKINDNQDAIKGLNDKLDDILDKLKSIDDTVSNIERQ